MYKWLTLGIFAYGLYTKFREVSKQSDDWWYKIVDWRIRAATLTAAYITFNVEFINKTTAGATIRNINLAFEIEGTKIGDVLIPKQYEVPESGSVVVEMNVLVKYAELKGAVTKIVNLLKSGGDFPVRIKGAFETKTPFGVFVRIPVNVLTSAKGIYQAFN